MILLLSLPLFSACTASPDQSEEDDHADAGFVEAPPLETVPPAQVADPMTHLDVAESFGRRAVKVCFLPSKDWNWSASVLHFTLVVDGGYHGTLALVDDEFTLGTRNCGYASFVAKQGTYPLLEFVHDGVRTLADSKLFVYADPATHSDAFAFEATWRTFGYVVSYDVDRGVLLEPPPPGYEETYPSPPIVAPTDPAAQPTPTKTKSPSWQDEQESGRVLPTMD